MTDAAGEPLVWARIDDIPIEDGVLHDTAVADFSRAPLYGDFDQLALEVPASDVGTGSGRVLPSVRGMPSHGLCQVRCSATARWMWEEGSEYGVTSDLPLTRTTKGLRRW